MRARPRAAAILGAGLLARLCAATAVAAPVELPLDPEHAAVGFRAYALGLLPMDGSFANFHGVLSIDPEHPTVCQVDVTVEVDSLHMRDPAIREDVLSPSLLDAKAFRTLRYSGTCTGNGIAGTLTMHGVTRPLFLAAARDGNQYSAQASLRRTEWNITGRPVLAGQTIRIRVSTTLPGVRAP